MTRSITQCLCALILLANNAYAQSDLVEADSEIFENAINAFEQKDFQTAVELFTALADAKQHSSSTVIDNV
mgnify:CR=1 FL=1